MRAHLCLVKRKYCLILCLVSYAQEYYIVMTYRIRCQNTVFAGLKFCNAAFLLGLCFYSQRRLWEVKRFYIFILKSGQGQEVY